MSNELEERIIDPNLENDPAKYEVVFTGRFNTAELLRQAFEEAAVVSQGFLSVVIEKKTGKIMIGDTHTNMQAESGTNPNDYSLTYARYDRASGRIEVMDYSDFRAAKADRQKSSEIKDIIATKLHEAIYGN